MSLRLWRRLVCFYMHGRLAVSGDVSCLIRGCPTSGFAAHFEQRRSLACERFSPRSRFSGDSACTRPWKPEYAQADAAVQDWFKNTELTPEAQKRLIFKTCWGPFRRRAHPLSRQQDRRRRRVAMARRRERLANHSGRHHPMGQARARRPSDAVRDRPLARLFLSAGGRDLATVNHEGQSPWTTC